MEWVLREGGEGLEEGVSGAVGGEGEPEEDDMRVVVVDEEEEGRGERGGCVDGEEEEEEEEERIREGMGGLRVKDGIEES